MKLQYFAHASRRCRVSTSRESSLHGKYFTPECRLSQRATSRLGRTESETQKSHPSWWRHQCSVPRWTWECATNLSGWSWHLTRRRLRTNPCGHLRSEVSWNTLASQPMKLGWNNTSATQLARMPLERDVEFEEPQSSSAQCGRLPVSSMAPVAASQHAKGI